VLLYVILIFLGSIMVFLVYKAIDDFYLLWVDTSWQAVWHHRPLDRSQSWSVWTNWHSWGVHLQSKKISSCKRLFYSLETNILLDKKYKVIPSWSSLCTKLLMFFIYYGVDSSWRVVWHYRPLNRSWYGLYKSIGIHEVSTFNLKNISSCNNLFNFLGTNILIDKMYKVPC